MAVHSICRPQHITPGFVKHGILCLIAVGLFLNAFSFSCNHLSWDVVGSFLGLINNKKYIYKTMA